jgi:phage/plasmid-like protein (TIGR03299 family)
MTAAVETMSFVGEVPWHRFGTKVDDEESMYSWEKFRDRAGLNWGVHKEPLYTESYVRQLIQETMTSMTDMSQNMESNTNGYGTVRDDNKQTLGIVGPQYRVLQNADAFKFFQSWLDTKKVSLHTAGSLLDGRKVWVLAQIMDDPLVKIANGDEVAKFLLLSNSHDGTTSVRQLELYVQILWLWHIVMVS